MRILKAGTVYFLLVFAAGFALGVVPSGASGGDLGSFGPGEMVPEFDRVVFSGELNKVHGPVKTQFGYRLLEITSRSE